MIGKCVGLQSWHIRYFDGVAVDLILSRMAENPRGRLIAQKTQCAKVTGKFMQSILGLEAPQ